MTSDLADWLVDADEVVADPFVDHQDPEVCWRCDARPADGPVGLCGDCRVTLEADRTEPPELTDPNHVDLAERVERGEGPFAYPVTRITAEWLRRGGYVRPLPFEFEEEAPLRRFEPGVVYAASPGTEAAAERVRGVLRVSLGRRHRRDRWPRVGPAPPPSASTAPAPSSAAAPAPPPHDRPPPRRSPMTIDLERIRERADAAGRDPDLEGLVESVIALDVPALIAEVERLRGELDAAQDEVLLRHGAPRVLTDVRIVEMGPSLDGPYPIESVEGSAP